ncbi:hypothetical protein [Virgisporangium aurantiacum]|uniref:Suppressor of fused protein (SUFU) n=1 Tax=Virgisporangium aurantiacum TaxID=175570 RepID=A0A8J4E3V0_9ACTN|nr:hypothetical protein [Virgisporangium aurantiacum]GIJ60328.1 hypothetical protein Vau01_078440 [Virgisporangium aurantiacum]
MADDLLDRHNDASHRARYDVWSAWGTVGTHVVAPIVNPAFMGGTRWPGLRQAHLVVRRDGAVLVASDGLADPAEWSDADPTNGLGVEAYAITGDDIGDSVDVMRVGVSWLGAMVRTVSNTLAAEGWPLIDALTRYRIMTIGLTDILGAERERWVDDGGMSVAMLGLTDPEIADVVPGPLSPIRFLNVKLLTRQEADFCVEDERGSAAARAELARRFAAQGNVLRSSLARESVI